MITLPVTVQVMAPISLIEDDASAPNSPYIAVIGTSNWVLFLSVD